MSTPPDSSKPLAFHPIPVESWLKKCQEEILEPDLPIVDPHHHLWRRGEWIYEGEELRADLLSGHDIRATVFLQCGERHHQHGPESLRPVGETEYVRGVAESLDSRYQVHACQAIVGRADLTLGAEVDAVLEAQIAAGAGRFRGIRHGVATIDDDPVVSTQPGRPPAGLLLDSRYRAGAARLQKFGLSFDSWAYHTQLDDLATLAKALPELPIMINHVGGPLGIGRWDGKRDDVFAQWRVSMAKLSQFPNVHVKLGGLGMRSIGYGYFGRPSPPSSAELARDWAPWIDFCISNFGPARCMFESNFPVDRCSTSYAVLWNAFKRLASGYSKAEKRDLFGATAIRFYRLDAALLQ